MYCIIRLLGSTASAESYHCELPAIGYTPLFRHRAADGERDLAGRGRAGFRHALAHSAGRHRRAGAGQTTYTSNSGLPKLREHICGLLARRYGAHYDPETECLITVGVSEGLDLALRVLLNPGDEVLVPEPCYVSYMPCIEFAGGTPVPVPSDACDGFRLHAERIAERITPRTKALLLASPANPTGATQSREDLQRLVALAQKHDFYLLSDEIYDRLTYVGQHTCLGALPGAFERTIVFNGFSKAYAMTGWRIGYTCAPAPITTLMTRVHQYTMLCAPHIAQMAAIEAIAHADEDVEEMVADYDRRRRFFVHGLNAMGLDCYEPRGAFYAFPSVRRFGLSSEEFAERLLMEERVAVVPGTAFGAIRGGPCALFLCHQHGAAGGSPGTHETLCRPLEAAVRAQAGTRHSMRRPDFAYLFSLVSQSFCCILLGGLLGSTGVCRPHRSGAGRTDACAQRLPGGVCRDAIPH